jgi:hypothetical protein
VAVIEIPIEHAQRLGRLLAAARVWRANLIPGTSSGLQGPTAALVAAVEAFEQDPDTGDEDDESRPDAGSGVEDQGGG